MIYMYYVIYSYTKYKVYKHYIKAYTLIVFH